VRQVRARGEQVSHVHLRYLNPFPSNLGEIISRFAKVLVPELNRGQLRMLLRAEFLVDAIGLNKIQGKPFKISEVANKIRETVGKKPKEYNGAPAAADNAGDVGGG
jgi:2-oxoglutarate ferredoxin oxidoreductase subunit alpha